MRICSGGFGRSRSLVRAGTKSSATVQQMQPFGSSTMSSSVQPLMPQPSMKEPSKPRSPNSLTRPRAGALRRSREGGARGSSCPRRESRSRWCRGFWKGRSSRHPWLSVVGRSGSHEGRDAGDHALAEGFRALAPGNKAVVRRRIASHAVEDRLDRRGQGRGRRKCRSIVPGPSPRPCMAVCRPKGTRPPATERAARRRARRPRKEHGREARRGANPARRDPRRVGK